MKHRGKILKAAIENSGYKIENVAAKLGISRNTLYNRFKKANVDYSFILAIEKIIHYDFTNDFPDLGKIKQEKNHTIFDTEQKNLEKKEEELTKKYSELLEDYKKLLHCLIKVANKNELDIIKKTISRFIDDIS